MTIVVNVSDVKVSNGPQDVLATYSLGSCIAIAVFDPAARVGGLLHYQLPSASIDPARAQENPAMFGDTGMALLLQRVASLGAQKQRLKVKLAGGAQMLNDTSLFNIGKRNHAAIRKILWQNGMFIEGEEVGGTAPRNMYLSIADGKVIIKTMTGTQSATMKVSA